MLSYILIVFILQEEGLVYNKLKENACLIETTKTYRLLTTYSLILCIVNRECWSTIAVRSMQVRVRINISNHPRVCEGVNKIDNLLEIGGYIRLLQTQLQNSIKVLRVLMGVVA